MPSRGRSVNAVGVRRRLLVLLAEISAGVPDAPSLWFAGWCGTAVAGRLLLAVEKSADAVVPAGIVIAGKG